MGSLIVKWFARSWRFDAEEAAIRWDDTVAEVFDEDALRAQRH